MRRYNAVDGLPFRRHRAPFGGRDMLGDLRQFARAHVVEAALAEIERADQRPMDDEIGVAANGRGEMGVAAQVEAEMAVVLVAVFGLRLGAQHHFVDQGLDRLPAHAAQDAVEMRRAHALALGQFDADGAEELDQVVELLDARRVMGAIEERRMRGFERLGGGDIGEDHEFLDQPMRLEPLRPSHVLEPPLAVENELALGQIEIERVAPFALDLDRPNGRRRAASARCRGAASSSRPAARRSRLSLLVRKLGGGAHHDAVELVRALAPVGAEDHAHRERRPVLVRAQRAEVVGDALRQHRHDPVGEIDRVAALERLPVQGRAGTDVGRDVGDGDGDDEPARVAGIGIGRGMDRVVVVLGVGRIDGDERQRAPVLARGAEPNGPRRFGLFQRRGREDMREYDASRAR